MHVPIRIVNVVATACLVFSVDLERLQARFPCEVRYDSRIYSGRVAYFKSKGMEGKVSIFSSGKMISVGTKSAKRAVEELRTVAQAIGTKLKTPPKIKNLVAIADLKSPVDLEKFVTLIEREKEFNIIYEPEVFPSVILKVPIQKSATSTMLLFSSGRLICAGLTEYKQICKAVEEVVKKVSLMRDE